MSFYIIHRLFGDDDGGGSVGGVWVGGDESSAFHASLYASTGDANYIRSFDINFAGESDETDEFFFDTVYEEGDHHTAWTWTGASLGGAAQPCVLWAAMVAAKP